MYTFFFEDNQVLLLLFFFFKKEDKAIYMILEESEWVSREGKKGKM